MSSNGEIDHEAALHLMAHSPEYRELVRQRVSEVKKRQRKSDQSIYQAFWGNGYHWREDIDLLTERFGREIEGCG